MTKQITITVNDWVINEIVGIVKNKSQRVEELIIKGFMAEKGLNTQANTSTIKGTFYNLASKLRFLIYRSYIKITWVLAKPIQMFYI